MVGVRGHVCVVVRMAVNGYEYVGSLTFSPTRPVLPTLQLCTRGCPFACPYWRLGHVRVVVRLTADR